MKKFVFITSCALVLIGCSSASNTDELNALSERVAELEELNNELASENTSLKSENTSLKAENTSLKAELNTPKPTPTPEPEPELAYDDFDPKCETTRVSSTPSLYMDVTITNATSERVTFSTTIDIYYKGDWVDSTSAVLSDLPAGRTLTKETLQMYTPDGRSLRVADYTCEVAEFSWR